MARVTVEDSLETIPNCYALIRVVSQRAKQLLGGSQPLVAEVQNRAIVTALREVAAGKVTTQLEPEQPSQVPQEEK